MPDSADTIVATLADRLGYFFRDPDLLRVALTHSSARMATPAARDNERLEFLGDRVLGLAVAELLAERFAEATEGELARRLNVLVRKDTCAQVAQELDLGSLIHMSGGEAESGGREKVTILADACEAVLGAVFLDGGFDAARSVIRALWTPHLGDSDIVPTDAKSALQEWAQGRGLPLPHYRQVERRGPDHAPHFTTEVTIDGLTPARGEGSSKRASEQAAAAAFLRREGVWHDRE